MCIRQKQNAPVRTFPIQHTCFSHLEVLAPQMGYQIFITSNHISSHWAPVGIWALVLYFPVFLLCVWRLHHQHSCNSHTQGRHLHTLRIGPQQSYYWIYEPHEGQRHKVHSLSGWDYCHQCRSNVENTYVGRRSLSNFIHQEVVCNVLIDFHVWVWASSAHPLCPSLLGCLLSVAPYSGHCITLGPHPYYQPIGDIGFRRAYDW